MLQRSQTSHKRLELFFKSQIHVGQFYSHNTLLLLFDVTVIMKPEGKTVARDKFCDKIAGTVLQNIHRIELFADMRGNRLR